MQKTTRKRRRQTDAVIILWRDSTPVVDDLDGLESIILEADLWGCCGQQSRSRRMDPPMDVAPASRLFSTSSLTAVCRSMTTWPEVMRWTEWASMALMVDSLISAGTRFLWRDNTDRPEWQLT